jgi:phosphoglycerate dehydrogenase-like enzyme
VNLAAFCRALKEWIGGAVDVYEAEPVKPSAVALENITVTNHRAGDRARTAALLGEQLVKLLRGSRTSLSIEVLKRKPTDGIGEFR